MRRKRLNRNWKPKRNVEGTRKERMLNMNSLPYFKYDLKNLLKRSKMEDNIKNSFTATLISKASRMSISDAKDYVRDKCEDGTLEEEFLKEILALLDRNSKYR